MDEITSGPILTTKELLHRLLATCVAFMLVSILYINTIPIENTAELVASATEEEHSEH